MLVTINYYFWSQKAGRFKYYICEDGRYVGPWHIIRGVLTTNILWMICTLLTVGMYYVLIHLKLSESNTLGLHCFPIELFLWKLIILTKTMIWRWRGQVEPKLNETEILFLWMDLWSCLDQMKSYLTCISEIEGSTLNSHFYFHFAFKGSTLRSSLSQHSLLKDAETKISALHVFLSSKISKLCVI